MTEEQICRDCGAKTVSEAPERLCFTCQIKRSTADGHGSGNDTYFFDESDDRTIHDGLEDRITSALASIRVESEIGRGGMGIVFKGMQEKLGRAVAIKVLPPYPDQDARFTERFLQEGRAMARLMHPGIVAIHDFGQTDCGLSYIVMEFVDGKSLSTMMADGPIKPQVFLDIIAQIADALVYAHGQEIVHRDMKPDNVLVDHQGHAKIADFGIAKLEGERHVARLTKTHQILGTPLYMAPEQALSAAKVDHRADIYALGVMLYEGLTGQFPAKTVEPPSKLATLDRRVDALVASLLQKNPEQRTITAAELASQSRQISRSWKDNSKRGLLGRMFGG